MSSHGQNRTGEDSCAVKPSAGAANVPPSGWAAIVATLGKSQVDNFALEGTGEGGAPVAPCKDGDGLGALLSSAPCDYPGNALFPASGGTFCTRASPFSYSLMTIGFRPQVR